MSDHRCCGGSEATESGVIRKEIIRETRIETVREIIVYADGSGGVLVPAASLDHCPASSSVSDTTWGSACWKWDSLQQAWALLGTYHTKPGSRCFPPGQTESAGNAHLVKDCVGPA